VRKASGAVRAWRARGGGAGEVPASAHAPAPRFFMRKRPCVPTPAPKGYGDARGARLAHDLADVAGGLGHLAQLGAREARKRQRDAAT
jgi:hypothetical protein